MQNKITALQAEFGELSLVSVVNCSSAVNGLTAFSAVNRNKYR